MSHQLTIEPLGATVDVEPGQTMLDAALRAGIYLPHACGHGLCGSCKVQVLCGEVDLGAANPFALMDFERDEGRALACCATLEDDCTIEAEIEEEPDAEVIPVADFDARIERLDDLTPTIRAIHLVLDRPLRYQAGQYVQLRIPGLDQPRAFSIANAPGADGSSTRIELNVRRVPGGEATTWLHGKAEVGQTLKLAGPYGRFFVRASAHKPMLFLAGGSGLSSPRAMIHDLLGRGCELPITLVYGQRSAAELYYDAEFRALAAAHPNFRYLPALSDESVEGVAHGYVHDAARQLFENDFSGHQAYLCGPPLMIDACITALMQGRLYERDIYNEKFISAADAQQVRSPLFRRV